MKFAKITALLGIAQVMFHNNLFGKQYAKFSEEELETIENALQNPATDKSEELQEQINQLTEANRKLTGIQNTLEASVTAALAVSSLDAQASIEESIALLGAKCKEYGESQNRHSFPENNGTEEPTNGLMYGYADPNDEHNKMLAEL